MVTYYVGGKIVGTEAEKDATLSVPANTTFIQTDDFTEWIFDGISTWNPIVGASTWTFEDNFSTTANWVQVNTKVSVNTGTNKIDWDLKRDGLPQTLTHDLGAGTEADDESWLLRFPLTMTTLVPPSSSASAGWFGIFDGTGDGTVSQDGIYVYIVVGLGNPSFLIGASNNEVPNGIAQKATFTTIPTDGETYFVEIKRNSATSATATLFADSGYSTPLEPEQTFTISAGTQSLRYIKITNNNQSSRTGTFTGTLNANLQFNNATTLPP